MATIRRATPSFTSLKILRVQAPGEVASHEETNPMKFALLFSLLALSFLSGCAEEREGNGVNIHENLGRRYYELEHENDHSSSHSRYDK